MLDRIMAQGLGSISTHLLLFGSGKFVKKRGQTLYYNMWEWNAGQDIEVEIIRDKDDSSVHGAVLYGVRRCCFDSSSMRSFESVPSSYSPSNSF